MTINKQHTYIINIEEENNIMSDHSIVNISDLRFTGQQLLEAIIFAGMPDVYLSSKKIKQKDVIDFKIKLFKTFVEEICLDKRNHLYEIAFDKDKKAYLDPSEIAAINYWLGMIMITVLGRIKYNYEYMVHLSLVERFSCRISLDKRVFRTNKRIVFKSPDLLAITKDSNGYGIFESKGYSAYSKRTMEKAYIQAKSINSINGNKPRHCLAVMTLTGGDSIQMVEKDPDGEEGLLEIDKAFIAFYQYIPIVELMDELGVIKISDKIYAYFEEIDTKFYMDCELYNLLAPYLRLQEQNDVKEYFEKNLSRIENCIKNIIDDNRNLFIVE